MIDLRAARSDPDAFRAALARKGAAELFDSLLAADAGWREASTRRDEVRAEQKRLGKPSSPEEIDEARRLKDELRSLDEALAAAEAERQSLWDQVPNPPHESVPEGETEDDVLEVRRSGEPPAGEAAKEHTEVGRFDMERAAKVSGSRFGYWIGDTALLALALYRYALDRLVAQGFVRCCRRCSCARAPCTAPDGYRRPTRTSTSSRARISTSPGRRRSRWAACTATRCSTRTPCRFVTSASPPCFRSEAGAAGKDTSGMFRVHQFNKVEQFVFTRPEDSWDEHERLLANTEGLVTELGVPYRVVVLPSGDMSKASAKTYDVELWFPSYGRFRETASVSNTTDYQARRLGTRFRAERDPEPVHTLNGTAVVDRMALAILENYQGDVPDVLQAFGAPARIR